VKHRKQADLGEREHRNNIVKVSRCAVRSRSNNYQLTGLRFYVPLDTD